MPETLAGARIIIAGGSGGLGSAAAELLAAEGARLVVSYRVNHERAARMASFAEIVQADLAAAEDRNRLLDAAPDFDALAIFPGNPARETDLEAALRISYEVNFFGPLMLAREAAARLKQAGRPGSIVLISTMQAEAVFAGSTAYAAPKKALVHAARILAKECRGPSNIRINVICPGVNQAGMAEASIAAGKYNRYVEQGIIPRFGRAADVARAVRFFLEPDNYITGQVLTVDGGLTL